VGSGWKIDTQHSEVGFRIRHLVGRVRGVFDDWDGVLVTRDQDWTHGTVNVNVKTRSIDTRNSARDADLRSPRFFSVDSFPAMTFESTGLIATNNNFEMGGLLTIKGRTHPVTFRGQYRGIARDMNGRERIAFDGTALINRRDFGLTWNQALEAGSLLSDDVEIEIAVEAVRQ
jgi:polyisoprenoid-binding protein YceI